MGAPRAGLRRNALCSLGILAVIAAIALGLPALDRALPRERALPVGIAYPLTNAVTVVPPAGTRIDLTGTRPGRDSGYALFLVGRLRFTVLVSNEHLSLAAAAERLRTRLRDGLGAHTTGPERPLDGVAPTWALAGRFRSGPDSGWYAVRVFGPGTVVDLTASGPPGELVERLPAIEASAASLARSR
jgi:hypothetical protein